MLSQSQRAIIQRAKTLGGGEQGVALDDERCVALLAVVMRDLECLEAFPELPKDLPDFFDVDPPDSLRLAGFDLFRLFERAVRLNADADTYFACLATLHKSRLKYRRILEVQPIPTVDQVGPRALLQYGPFPPRELAAFLFWRKWMFEIDNRAAQETGYLFEPIIASAVGGVPASARQSPVRRREDPSKGRQVDCIRDNLAYEVKLRVTIAASGQGRWQEEMDFPQDCVASGFVPVLVVFDATPNPKLTELRNAFVEVGGAAYVGDDAWLHLEAAAGPTMALFLDRYVRSPLDDLLRQMPTELPDLTLSMTAEAVVFKIADFRHTVPRLANLGDVAQGD